MQKDQINVKKHGDKPPRRLLDRVSDRLRVKGHSPKTEEAYRDWAKGYVLFSSAIPGKMLVVMTVHATRYTMREALWFELNPPLRDSVQRLSASESSVRDKQDPF